jgi:hypothetical protein
MLFHSSGSPDQCVLSSYMMVQKVHPEMGSNSSQCNSRQSILKLASTLTFHDVKVSMCWQRFSIGNRSVKWKAHGVETIIVYGCFSYILVFEHSSFPVRWQRSSLPPTVQDWQNATKDEGNTRVFFLLRTSCPRWSAPNVIGSVLMLKGRPTLLRNGMNHRVSTALPERPAIEILRMKQRALDRLFM